MQVRNPDYQERLNHIVQGAAFIRLLGLELRDAGPGWCETRLPLDPRHRQQDGYTHAGVQATMADHTAGCAAFTLVAAEQIVLSVEFKINLLRPAVGDFLACRSEVLRGGRNLIVAESWIRAGEAADLCAKATVTLAVVVDPAGGHDQRASP